MRKPLVHLNAVVAAQNRVEPLPLGKTGQNQLASPYRARGRRFSRNAASFGSF